jgi:hypothetical protein
MYPLAPLLKRGTPPVAGRGVLGFIGRRLTGKRLSGILINREHRSMNFDERRFCTRILVPEACSNDLRLRADTITSTIRKTPPVCRRGFCFAPADASFDRSRFPMYKDAMPRMCGRRRNMKVAIRLVLLRFDILKKPEEQSFCPVGLFFRSDGAGASSNVFIKCSGETPGLPVILAFPESAFPDPAQNAGPLEKMAVAPLYRGEYRLEEVSSVEVPEGVKKLDKHLFTSFVAESSWFIDKRPIYRFRMHRYFVPTDRNDVVSV